MLGNLDSGIREILSCGIQHPSSTDKESGILYLEYEIHSVESRIQDCLGSLTWGGRRF